MPVTWAQSSSSSDAAAFLAALPSCALPCLVTAIGNSNCSATDTACQCADTQLNEEVALCVGASCTLKESLTTKNLTETNCHAPIRDKSRDYSITAVTLGSVAGLFLILRVVHKFFVLKSALGMDDWFVIVVIISGIPSTVMSVHGLAANGLGKDIWTVPFDQITKFVMYFYIMEILYFAQVAILKLSILFFYLRIFPAQGIRRLLWGTVALNSVFGLAFVFVAIFQCSPIQFYWERWDLEHEGTCYSINAMAWANAGMSIMIDIWMLALPIWQIKSLKLNWKKKVGVGMMFSVGTFVTVVSILRLQSLVHFANSLNPTWDQLDIANWSTVEINVGIICACMPSLRLILVKLFPRVMGTTHDRTARSQYYYGQNSKVRRRSRSFGQMRIASRVSSDGVGKVQTPGIVYSKSYAVEYGDNDEASLVPMKDLDLEAKGGPTVRATSDDIVQGKAWADR
ncbi:CFEM domain-containing protein [Pseudomassariella vexata]|uniref:CFEM domain-containing protein n=1 Tax=Pseudomassariella vexata TaxID=1141098 RepID=A0A1Y2DH05_9PEZI|nr:CFEM domain-containing protein [Pseudomassariella vexata]ORY58549.1 CFEM domain-containing protein [Pseudomassariella vexata]